MQHPGILGSDQSEISPLQCTLPNRMSMTIWIQYSNYSKCMFIDIQTTHRQSVHRRGYNAAQMHVCDSQLYTHVKIFLHILSPFFNLLGGGKSTSFFISSPSSFIRG